MKTKLRKIVLIMMVTLIALPFSLLTKDISADETHPRVGVVTGSVFAELVLKDNPNAQVEYFNNTFDLPIALESGKIDAYALDEPVAKLLCNMYTDQYISKKLSFEDYGILVNKSKPELLKQLNEYLARLDNNGELLKLQNKWFDADDTAKTVDYESIKNNKPVIKLATFSSLEPFDYVKDGKHAGYEIDLVASFCKEYGYGLEIEDSNFSGVLAAITSGKTDLGTCVATITEERKDTMSFSSSIYQGGTVCVKKKTAHTSIINSVDDLKDKTIGVQSGATYDKFIAEKIDNPNIEYFKLVSDMISSLDENEISAFAVDRNVADTIIREYEDEYKILENIKNTSHGFALPKTNDNSIELYSKLDSFIKKIKNNGTLEEISNIWTSDDNSLKTINKEDLTGENGTLIFAVSSSVDKPFVYTRNNEILGCDIDIIYRFAREYGYDIKVEDYSVDGLFSAISLGKCDIGAAGISITDEREKYMYFPESYYESNCVLVVKNNSNINFVDNNEKGFFENIVESIDKTFIKENRWKMFLSGIFTTMYVTFLSIIFGTILGFVIYMLYRNIGVFGKAIMDIISNIIQKTPLVVLLMILYYVVFGDLGISGETVSIIGLTIIFTNAVKRLLVMGVDSINEGQYDAALALGYSKNKAFIRMILPQAIINVMSGYKSDIISLIKDSSIVGYIAVQDLTKVSDIVRSRTYEAFFPLITTAIIYYVITSIIVLIISKIKIKGKHNNKSSFIEFK